MSAHLSAAEVLESTDLEFEDSIVPEWKKKNGEPGTIQLYQLPADELMIMNDLMTKPEYKNDGMFIILVFCARDPESGDRLFPIPMDGTEDELKEALGKHVSRLKKKSMRVLNRLQRIAMRLNAMTKASEVTLKKDSSEAGTGGSPTVSHVN